MPHKKDYSAMMTNEAFWDKWNSWKPLAYKVVLSNLNSYPLTTCPATPDVEDVVHDLMLETHRLGIFARFDPNRGSSEMTYVAAQFKSMLAHKWQDHKRVHHRTAISCNTAADSAADAYDEGSSATASNNIIDIPSAIDPNIDWSLGSPRTDDLASINITSKCLKKALSSCPSVSTPAAIAIIDLLTSHEDAVPSNSNPSIAAALGLDKATVAAARKSLAAAAADLN